MKIYTKTGDSGETGLYGGARVPKDDLLIHAYGTIDELNAIFGLIRAQGLSSSLEPLFSRVQHELFELGADLATPWPDKINSKKISRICEFFVEKLEEEIDGFQEKLTPLTQFIVPGGSVVASLLHLARTVCRRAERCIATLYAQKKINPLSLQYVNRLSDWLFVLARTANQEANLTDQPWEPREKR